MKRLIEFLRRRGNTAEYGPRQWIVTVLVAIPLWIVPFLVSSLLWAISAGVTQLRMGWDRHVAYPLIVSKRALAGEPLWRSVDLLWNVQPFTKKARELASADHDLVNISCGCGKATCENKNGRFVFMWQVPQIVADHPELGSQLATGRAVMTRPPPASFEDKPTSD